MQASHHQTTAPHPAQSPRFVLITAAPETDVSAPAPLRIIGSEPRMTGQFRLTDR